MKNTAIILMHCPDQKGIIAATTDFILKNNGNIIHIDQHVDATIAKFFMRVEWELDHFQIPKQEIEATFASVIGSRFDATFQLHFSPYKPKVALFVSKYGHCFFDLLSRYESNELPIEIPLIISNHKDFEHVAERYGIPFYHFKINKENKVSQEEKQLKLLKEADVDLIVLARYMQILTPEFCATYPNQIINIHHSSLPAFAGAKPYNAAYERGVKFMGATAHYVTGVLDAGPIIAQDVVSISHKNSIEDMIHKGRDIEKVVLASAVWSHIHSKVMVYHNKTVVFD